MNIIMVQFWGIYGVIFSTVASFLVIGVPWLLHNLFSTIFEKKWLKEYVVLLINYVVTTILIAILTCVVCSFIVGNPVVTLIVRGIVCCIIPNVIFFLIYKKQKEFLNSFEILNRITKGKLKKLIKIK